MKVYKSFTRLLVNDWKACVSFYKDIMEFESFHEDERGGYAEFHVADMRLSIFRRSEMARMVHNLEKPPTAECQDTVVLIFTVNDLEEECIILIKIGIKLSTEPMNNPMYGIKTAFLRDPDENLIGLYQMLA
ncbi:MAG: VOC family protein [Rivularia sp. ALOHA_DT_140]|nr:VOC family protein [Rivularia sp. ALOHA_DT_140]